MEKQEPLRTLGSMLGWQVVATDGRVGRVTDFLIEDTDWILGYLVIRRAGWLRGSHLLIPCRSIRSLDPARRRIILKLTRAQVREARLLSAVTRKTSSLARRLVTSPGPHDDFDPSPWFVDQDRAQGFRSFRELRRYVIEHAGKVLGRVHDFMVETLGWAVQLMVVEMGRWLRSRRVALSAELIGGVSWFVRSILLEPDAVNPCEFPCFSLPASALQDGAPRRWL